MKAPLTQTQIYQKAYRERNREAVAAKNKQWAATHKEYLREYNKRYRTENPSNAEAMRAASAKWYRANRERRLARTKAYKLENSERTKARQKAYDARPDRVAKRYAFTKRYLKAHPEISRAYAVRRKARIRGAKHLSKRANAIVREWKAAPSFICYYCQIKFATKHLHVDHVKALVNGGQHTEDNIVRSCSTCNLKKRHLPIGALEFLPQSLLSL